MAYFLESKDNLNYLDSNIYITVKIVSIALTTYAAHNTDDELLSL